MADIVETVLKEAAEKEAKLKPIHVEKAIELSIDPGNLLAIDQNPIDIKAYRKSKDTFLLNLARDNTQLLLNKIWELPHERKDDVILAMLPEPKTPIPREKPIPKDKPLTKWQKFANLKGIQNRKKSRMIWDEASKSYKPRWGYKRANDDTKDWLIEVPANADPYEDQFAKRREAKKERVAKNELQRLRNIARSTKSKVPGVGITPTEKQTKDGLHRALTLAKRSTASVGKFTDSLPKETAARGMAKRRKFEANIHDFQAERKHQLELAQQVRSGGPKLDVKKAVNMHKLNDDGDERAKPNRGKGKGKKGKGGKGKARFTQRQQRQRDDDGGKASGKRVKGGKFKNRKR